MWSSVRYLNSLWSAGGSEHAAAKGVGLAKWIVVCAVYPQLGPGP